MSETKFKYAYEKLMAEHGLKLADLPEDAKHGISAIKNFEKTITMIEGKGGKVSPETYAKIKANDKWICGEIVDFVEDKDENDDEIPHDEDEIKDDLNEDLENEEEGEEEPINIDDSPETGLAIDGELAEMYESGKKEWSDEEIKAKAKTTYKVLFDTYEDDADNGIETTNYTLIETAKQSQIFTINKK